MAEEFKPCSIDGCNGNAHRTAYGRAGLCHPHYKKKRTYGDPLFSVGTSHGVPMQFYQDVVLAHDKDECLEWPYARSTQGYGNLWRDGKVRRVHQLVCLDINGEQPAPGYEVAHECGNGHLGCVAPRHLSWKTRKENMFDRIRHGTSPRGERCGKAKLTEMQVREIKSLEGKIGSRRLSRMFGVSRSTIIAIRHGKSWNWMDV